MNYLAKPALLDLLIAVIAHFTLTHHSDDEIFIDKATTDQVNRVKHALDGLLHEYMSIHHKKLMSFMKSVENRAAVKKGVYDVTDVGLAFNMLYLGFAPNERKGDRIFNPMVQFWKKYQRTLLSVSSKADNGKKYEKYASDSFVVANIYLDAIKELRD